LEALPKFWSEVDGIICGATARDLLLINVAPFFLEWEALLILRMLHQGDTTS
jgi:hypothetical protein